MLGRTKGGSAQHWPYTALTVMARVGAFAALGTSASGRPASDRREYLPGQSVRPAQTAGRKLTSVYSRWRRSPGI